MAAHVAAEADRFNCDKCPWGRHCDESNPAPYAKFVIQISGRPFMESRTCFLPMISAQSHAMLRLHLHYRNGILAHAGGISDQEQIYVQAMEVLEQTYHEIERQRLKDRAREAEF